MYIDLFICICCVAFGKTKPNQSNDNIRKLRLHSNIIQLMKIDINITLFKECSKMTRNMVLYKHNICTDNKDK